MIKLLHGDCYELIKQIPDKSIDLVYIDIPYEYKFGAKGHSELSQRMQKRKYVDLVDMQDGIDFSIFDELDRIQEHIYIYIWCSRMQIYPIMKRYLEKGCKYNILVWCKTNPPPTTNSGWLSDIEYCLVFKEDGAPRYNDGYEIKSKWYLSPINKTDKDNWGHPTIKPLELVERHIKHSTKEGDTVLDCFMGSGTTGVACRNLNRNFIGMEINDEYFKIAERRLKEQPQEINLFDL